MPISLSHSQNERKAEHWCCTSGRRIAEKMRTAPPPLLLLLLVPFLATAASAKFLCSRDNTTTCSSLVGFQPANDTTYANVSSTFQVLLSSILSANGLPLSTSGGTAVRAGSTVRIPISCRCGNGNGWSDRTPVYTVSPNDTGLYDITVKRFGMLTTYQDIGAVNNLPDVNKITAGEQLWIPLPCSCDVVGGEEVVHLAHRVAAGSTVAVIAANFGTNESTLLDLNGMSDPKELKADQILDVPLRACSSSIFNTSLDYGLRLANGSYAITAGGCVTCSCNSTYRLECFQSQGSAQCPAPKACEGTSLLIGNSTRTSDGCEVECAYAGYHNATSGTAAVSIMTTNATADSTNCKSGVSGLRGFPWSAAALISLLIIWNIS